MRKYLSRLSTNLGLLLSGLASIFSGLLLQIEYHIGNAGNISANKEVLKISYLGWLDIHKLSVVILSCLMVIHFYLHWKWYSTVFKKKLFGKNMQVLTLSVIYILVVLTGFVPWVINLLDGSKVIRKGFIEIHDKLAIILTIYLILHMVSRLRWFIATINKVKINL